jgi:small GTP-binding protein
MPANLSPEYIDADRRYRQSATDEERLAALGEMLSAIPKHKGTEKLQADIKSRIAKLKVDVKKEGGKPRRQDPGYIKREGAGQVVLVGAPNSGKSALTASVTNAKVEVADYPFTTQKPQPAMMPYENVLVQLVDLPPVSPEHTPGWMANLIRNADVACLLADAGSDACAEDVESVLSVLAERHIELVREPSEQASVFSAVAEVPTLLVATKLDAADALARLEILREFQAARFAIFACSARNGEGLDALKQSLFSRLNVIRVCTKAPGKPPDTSHPFVLPVGSTVRDLARNIHKDLARSMTFARIWGQGKYDGQRVQRDHPLGDMDVVEIHA